LNNLVEYLQPCHLGMCIETKDNIP